jgi:uncharacterized repeat protein (TIGR03803 family)
LAAQLTTLVNFNGSNVQDPQNPLTVNANGDLFGTTTYGGAPGDGTVFETQNIGTLAAPPVIKRFPDPTVTSTWPFDPIPTIQNGAGRKKGLIVVRTQNPLDISRDEAGEIAATIRGLNLASEVRVEEQEREYRGLTWFEILHITLSFQAGQIVVDKATKEIAAIVVDWARRRFAGRKSGSKRPVYLEIHVRDDLGNRVMKAIVMKNATDEPEERTEQKRRMFERA